MHLVNNIFDYTKPSNIIDFDTSNEIQHLANKLLNNSNNLIDFIKNSFKYVRDNISHSADINGKKITCKASDVLAAKEGICYAKSHLLAALLRCKGVPAGFCYQRLILDDVTAPYLIIHGLNAVYIKETNKWIRLDARGNKPGVNARFSINPDNEKLAFLVRTEMGEEDIPYIFATPDVGVVKVLTEENNINDLWTNLPQNLI